MGTDIDTDGEVVELLQQLIRNRCVNDGTPGSGGEIRSATLLRSVLEGAGPDLELIEPTPERGSLVARLEGSDPTAPSLALMGHIDVVPANPETWRHDPFAGELVDGEVWGRGAVDMLNQTSAMAVAFRRLASSGFRPKGTLVFMAVADEEAGGVHGAEPLARDHLDAIRTDYCLTEVGGMFANAPGGGATVSVGTAEKGSAGARLTVRGMASHGSQPYATDNALITAAEIVRRIAAARTPSRLDETWSGWVRAQGFDPELEATLLDPDRTWEALPSLPPALARHAHACTHMTAAPTMVEPGPAQKINTIPDVVTLGVDIRLLPGQTGDDAAGFLDEVLGDLRERVTVEFPRGSRTGSSSPTDTPMWALMEKAAQRVYPEATLLPSMMTGATDARHLRPAGITTYGFGLLSRRLEPSRYWSMFHGKDERIDVESLALSAEMWEWLAREFVG